MNGGKPRERGAVLLLLLMVLAVLIVVVGQFAHTAALDWRIAWNHQREAQLRLDARAGVEAALQYAAERPPAQEDAAALSIDREEGGVVVRVEDESGKFNVNALLAPPKGVSPEQAEAALRRLLASADDPAGTLPQGLADAVVAKVKGAGAPLPTLDALRGAEGMTAEILWGESGDGGLSRVLTAYGDGRVRPGAGDDRVILALAPGLDADALDEIVGLLLNPGGKPSPRTAPLVQALAPWVRGDSEHYLASVRVQREESEKRVRAVLALGPDSARVVRFDEVQ
ncbi:MAG: general secretion pathway protein GspK [Planctomycetes bacterium]|jgi:hypothetical protein|nr:general secretion pathway protein GspK [Planctomycetota bacterium]